MKSVRQGRSCESYREEKMISERILGGSQDREDILAFIVEMENRWADPFQLP